MAFKSGSRGPRGAGVPLHETARSCQVSYLVWIRAKGRRSTLTLALHIQLRPHKPHRADLFPQCGVAHHLSRRAQLLRGGQRKLQAIAIRAVLIRIVQILDFARRSRSAVCINRSQKLVFRSSGLRSPASRGMSTIWRPPRSTARTQRSGAKGRAGSWSGKLASRSRMPARSASHPLQRKRDAPLTSAPRSSSSRTRASSLPVMPSICSTKSRRGRSCTTTRVMEMLPAASELSLTLTVAGRDIPCFFTLA